LGAAALRSRTDRGVRGGQMLVGVVSGVGLAGGQESGAGAGSSDHLAWRVWGDLRAVRAFVDWAEP